MVFVPCARRGFEVARFICLCVSYPGGGAATPSTLLNVAHDVVGVHCCYLFPGRFKLLPFGPFCVLMFDLYVQVPLTLSFFLRFRRAFFCVFFPGPAEFYEATDSGDPTYLNQLQKHCAAGQTIELKVRLVVVAFAVVCAATLVIALFMLAYLLDFLLLLLLS